MPYGALSAHSELVSFFSKFHVTYGMGEAAEGHGLSRNLNIRQKIFTDRELLGGRFFWFSKDFQLVLQEATTDSQYFSRLRLDPVALGQRTVDKMPFDRRERGIERALGRQEAIQGSEPLFGRGQLERQVARLNLLALGHQGGMSHHVLQLPHVARPGMAGQQLNGSRGKACSADAALLHEISQTGLGPEWNLIGSSA